MVILALESSAGPVSAALAENGKVLAVEFENNGLTHSATLLPMADRLLSKAGMTLSDVGAVAVAAGPGSFTGLRIGVSTAKGLAWGRELPCLAPSTLASMARQAAEDIRGIIVPVMDARRGQFYNAVFRAGAGLERLSPDRAIAAEELLAELERYSGEEIFFMGDGMEKFMQLTGGGLGRPMDEAHRWQSAAGVALEAWDMAARGEFVSAAKLVPNYIRLSQAERERLERLERERAGG